MCYAIIAHKQLFIVPSFYPSVEPCCYPKASSNLCREYKKEIKENMPEQNNAENLKQTISYILQFIANVEREDFGEAAIKQFIVLPILRALEWDDRNLDTLEVFPESPISPESQVGKGWVDYALRHEQKSLVFIECKRWSGNIEAADPQDQIARYIFQEGVDLGIITNGKTWDFYLAYKTHVPWRKRKFCSIELGNEPETIANFQKYLSKPKVLDGSAKAEAERVVAERMSIQWDPKPPSSEDSEILSRDDP